MKMKYTGVLFFILPLLLVLGCASVPEQVTEAVEAEEEVTISSEKPVIVEETVYLVEEELSWFADNVLDERKVHMYAEQSDAIMESLLYDSTGTLIERKSYQWQDGELASETTMKGDNGEILYSRRYNYRNGNRVEALLLNEEEQLQARQSWEYDPSGNKTRWNIYDGNNVLLAYTEYRYDEGLLSRIENYSPGGVLEELFIIEYDNGKEVKRTELNKSNDIVAYSSYRYQDGLLVEERLHRRNGAVRRRVLYKNGDHGKPVEILYLDQVDNILEKITLSYTERTVSRVLKD
jgi:YD repeat-containing protein